MVAASRCPAVPNLCRVRRGAAQQDRVRVGGVAALLDPGFQASAWMHFMCSTTRMLRRARCMRHHSSFAVQCNPTTAGGCRAWTPPPPAPLSPCTTSCTAWAYRWEGLCLDRCLPPWRRAPVGLQRWPMYYFALCMQPLVAGSAPCPTASPGGRTPQPLLPTASSSRPSSAAAHHHPHPRPPRQCAAPAGGPGTHPGAAHRCE